MSNHKTRRAKKSSKKSHRKVRRVTQKGGVRNGRVSSSQKVNQTAISKELRRVELLKELFGEQKNLDDVKNLPVDLLENFKNDMDAFSLYLRKFPIDVHQKIVQDLSKNKNVDEDDVSNLKSLLEKRPEYKNSKLEQLTPVQRPPAPAPPPRSGPLQKTPPPIPARTNSVELPSVSVGTSYVPADKIMPPYPYAEVRRNPSTKTKIPSFTAVAPQTATVQNNPSFNSSVEPSKLTVAAMSKRITNMLGSKPPVAQRPSKKIPPTPPPRQKIQTP